MHQNRFIGSVPELWEVAQMSLNYSRYYFYAAIALSVGVSESANAAHLRNPAALPGNPYVHSTHATKAHVVRGQISVGAKSPRVMVVQGNGSVPDIFIEGQPYYPAPPANQVIHPISGNQR